jgi:predicted glutamine amidotransferase
MCRFLGFHATHRTHLHCSLVDSPNSLLSQSEEDLSGFSHADGWGIARYEEPGHPIVVRTPHAANHGKHFATVARELETRAALVHVRRATVGRVSLENTHPFHHGPWSFAHNGTISYFREGVGDRMLGEMNEQHRDAIKGTTDSETLFHFIVNRIEERPEMPVFDVLCGALDEVISWCHAAGPTPKIGVNVIMTDGKQLIGSRWLRTLFFADHKGLYDCVFCGVPHAEASPPESYHATLIASEPTTMGPWEELPDRSAFQLGEDGELEVRRLE